ncbi:MAG TPA: CIA30 family protein [Kiritimatiellia bacterium]|nr:CIA30 family protein [Kiritimatiellia bacterium]
MKSNVSIRYPLLPLLITLPFTAMATEHEITNVKTGYGTHGWHIENDGVMGGVSSSTFIIHEDGYAVFSGDVSLDNNGGFASVQYGFEPIDVSRHTTLALRIKGDGKTYRLLVEDQPNAWHYYEIEFPTSGDWETIHIPLADLVPVRRGDRLDRPNFPGQTLAQVRIMIANARPESFSLLLERVWLN